MNILTGIAAQPKRFWRFMGFFQKPGLRVLHLLVATLVILQICSAITMQFVPKGSLFGKYHMAGGLTLCVLGLLLFITTLRTHGVRYFYPYLWGDLKQIRYDFGQIRSGILPPPRPYGLRAALEGLGLCLLLVTAYLGGTWFVLWQSGYPNAYTVLLTHAAVAPFMIAYVLVHGALGVIHFINWQKRVEV